MLYKCKLQKPTSSLLVKSYVFALRDGGHLWPDGNHLGFLGHNDVITSNWCQNRNLHGLHTCFLVFLFKGYVYVLLDGGRDTHGSTLTHADTRGHARTHMDKQDTHADTRGHTGTHTNTRWHTWTHTGTNTNTRGQSWTHTVTRGRIRTHGDTRGNTWEHTVTRGHLRTHANTHEHTWTHTYTRGHPRIQYLEKLPEAYHSCSQPWRLWMDMRRHRIASSQGNSTGCCCRL